MSLGDVDAISLSRCEVARYPTSRMWYALSVTWAVGLPLVGLVRPFAWTTALTVCCLIGLGNAVVCFAFGRARSGGEALRKRNKW